MDYNICDQLNIPGETFTRLIFFLFVQAEFPLNWHGMHSLEMIKDVVHALVYG